MSMDRSRDEDSSGSGASTIRHWRERDRDESSRRSVNERENRQLGQVAQHLGPGTTPTNTPDHGSPGEIVVDNDSSWVTETTETETDSDDSEIPIRELLWKNVSLRPYLVPPTQRRPQSSVRRIQSRAPRYDHTSPRSGALPPTNGATIRGPESRAPGTQPGSPQLLDADQTSSRLGLPNTGATAHSPAPGSNVLAVPAPGPGPRPTDASSNSAPDSYRVSTASTNPVEFFTSIVGKVKKLCKVREPRKDLASSGQWVSPFKHLDPNFRLEALLASGGAISVQTALDRHNFTNVINDTLFETEMEHYADYEHVNEGKVMLPPTPPGWDWRVFPEEFHFLYRGSTPPPPLPITFPPPPPLPRPHLPKLVSSFKITSGGVKSLEKKIVHFPENITSRVTWVPDPHVPNPYATTDFTWQLRRSKTRTMYPLSRSFLIRRKPLDNRRRVVYHGYKADVLWIGSYLRLFKEQQGNRENRYSVLALYEESPFFKELGMTTPVATMRACGKDNKDVRVSVRPTYFPNKKEWVYEKIRARADPPTYIGFDLPSFCGRHRKHCRAHWFQVPMGRDSEPVKLSMPMMWRVGKDHNELYRTPHGHQPELVARWTMGAITLDPTVEFYQLQLLGSATTGCLGDEFLRLAILTSAKFMNIFDFNAENKRK